ncbi:hypothetical protein GWK47_051205 [Chionoecetes opilio]|uniref:Uncharacterized protein n=1 Tax=Chionoecetes opilio TaxID=41210 RepID=A0A8J4Y111_CHIOP|nr:hypothetical protein GWK47_051205 [Chionoecetes opilio]
MSRTWLLSDSPGKTTRPHHTNCCYQGPSTDRPFCQEGAPLCFLPSALHKNVEPNGTADTASLYLVTPDLQECCERLEKAAITKLSAQLEERMVAMMERLSSVTLAIFTRTGRFLRGLGAELLLGAQSKWSHYCLAAALPAQC